MRCKDATRTDSTGPSHLHTPCPIGILRPCKGPSLIISQWRSVLLHHPSFLAPGRALLYGEGMWFHHSLGPRSTAGRGRWAWDARDRPRALDRHGAAYLASWVAPPWMLAAQRAYIGVPPRRLSSCIASFFDLRDRPLAELQARYSSLSCRTIPNQST